MADEDRDQRHERAKFIRVPRALHAAWLDRCHTEGIDPDHAAATKLKQALRLEGSVMLDPAAPSEEEE